MTSIYWSIESYLFFRSSVVLCICWLFVFFFFWHKQNVKNKRKEGADSHGTVSGCLDSDQFVNDVIAGHLIEPVDLLWLIRFLLLYSHVSTLIIVFNCFLWLLLIYRSIIITSYSCLFILSSIVHSLLSRSFPVKHLTTNTYGVDLCRYWSNQYQIAQ